MRYGLRLPARLPDARVAQLVEHATENGDLVELNSAPGHHTARGPIRGDDTMANELADLGLRSIPEFLGPSTAILADATSVSHPAPAPAAPFSAIYAFGDSLSDAGNAYIATGGATPVSPPYSDGRFSNGPVWVQDLSDFLGLGPLAPSLAQPSAPNRTDFAVGGAQTGTTPLHTAGTSDLPSQLAQFQAAVPDPQPDALSTRLDRLQ